MKTFITIDGSTQAQVYMPRFAGMLQQTFLREHCSVQLLNEPFGSADVKQGLLETIRSVQSKSGVGLRASYLLHLAARTELLEYICTATSSDVVILLGGPWKWLQDQNDVTVACDRMQKDHEPLQGLGHELARPYWPNLCVFVSLPCEPVDPGFSIECSPAACLNCRTNQIEAELVRIFNRACGLMAMAAEL